MNLPSCRDALSREISHPVRDPMTGRCFRNPCAAEEADVLDWEPGCVAPAPVYGSYDVAPVVWQTDVWWDGRPRHGGWGPWAGRPGHGRPGRRPRWIPRSQGPLSTAGPRFAPRPAPGPRSLFTPSLSARPAPGPRSLATGPSYSLRPMAPTIGRTQMASHPGVIATPRMNIAPTSISLPAQRVAMKGLGQEAVEGPPYFRILALLALGAVLYRLNAADA